MIKFRFFDSVKVSLRPFTQPKFFLVNLVLPKKALNSRKPFFLILENEKFIKKTSIVYHGHVLSSN